MSVNSFSENNNISYAYTTYDVSVGGHLHDDPSLLLSFVFHVLLIMRHAWLCFVCFTRWCVFICFITRDWFCHFSFSNLFIGYLFSFSLFFFLCGCVSVYICLGFLCLFCRFLPALHLYSCVYSRMPCGIGSGGGMC